jgi:hypothetical protein
MWCWPYTQIKISEISKFTSNFLSGKSCISSSCVHCERTLCRDRLSVRNNNNTNTNTNNNNNIILAYLYCQHHNVHFNNIFTVYFIVYFQIS